MSLPKIRLERCETAGDSLWRLDEAQERHLAKALRLYEGAMVEGLSPADGAKFLMRLENIGGRRFLKKIESIGS